MYKKLANFETYKTEDGPGKHLKKKLYFGVIYFAVYIYIYIYTHTYKYRRVYKNICG